MTTRTKGLKRCAARKNANPDELPQQGGDRLDFLYDANPSAMYMWFMLLRTGLFMSAKTEFTEDYQAEDGEAPSIDGQSSVASTSRETSLGEAESHLQGILHQSEKLTAHLDADSFERKKENHRRHLYASMQTMLNNKKLLNDEVDKVHQRMRGDKRDLFEARLGARKAEREDDSTMQEIFSERVGELEVTIAEHTRQISLKEEAIRGLEARILGKEDEIEKVTQEIKGIRKHGHNETPRQSGSRRPQSTVSTDDLEAETTRRRLRYHSPDNNADHDDGHDNDGHNIQEQDEVDTAEFDGDDINDTSK